jgi:hypothetical protein
MSRAVLVLPVKPVDYSEEVAAAICEAIATTPRGLDYLCAAYEGFPNRRTVTDWLNVHPEFRQQYEIAKDRQADLLAYECLEISDDCSRDTKTIKRNDGQEIEVLDREWVESKKLRVQTRQWMAGKLAPKKYGPKLGVSAAFGMISHEDALDQLT